MLACLAGVHPVLAQTANLSSAPAGMVLIPAGAFAMGDGLDGDKDAIPIRVMVSAFYMETNLVSYSQWRSVYIWAMRHGYVFIDAGAQPRRPTTLTRHRNVAASKSSAVDDSDEVYEGFYPTNGVGPQWARRGAPLDEAGMGKAPNHPVQNVQWYDCVEWCNARSQQEGLTPVYYRDAGLTQVYTNSKAAAHSGAIWEAPHVNWAAHGYRLPTEAEWEKAARGGLSGQRFPWGNTISESQANYKGSSDYTYDLGPIGYNAAFATGQKPYTSPVASFAPNGYGLYDMAGNVSQWCWDWHGTPYAGGTDPRGSAFGDVRVVRGGNWSDGATGGPSNGARSARCADHNQRLIPNGALDGLGFRCVRGL